MLRSPMRHLLSHFPPMLPLAFLLTAPHAWHWSLLFLGLPFSLVLLDAHAGRAIDAPNDESPRWPFDLLLYVHVALHFTILALHLRLAATVGLRSVDFWVGTFLVGHNAGWSAIVVAHELIHRRERHMQLLGRALLCTAFYEHFYTEHLRGHHARVATDDDPATARFGESLIAFKLRTIPAQLASAWRIEQNRVGLLRNRVLHGALVELAMAIAVFVLVGPSAFGALAIVAYFAINLLETVNYFEHWGLARTGKRVRTVDSWDTDYAFTHYALVGLARHADHHANASRPYHRLRHFQESPKLPYGYFGMVVLADMHNAAFQRRMTAELRRLQLGPFAPG